MLFDLIDDNSLRSGVLDGIQKDVGGNCDEEKSVQEDENYEEPVDPESDTDGNELVIRVGIEGCEHVHYEDGLTQCRIVTGKIVVYLVTREFYELVGHYREHNDHQCVKDEIDEDVDVCGEEGVEHLAHLGIVDYG